MSNLTNDQITAGAAVLDLDLDELQALCDAVKRPWYGTLQIADGVTDDDAAKFIEAFSPDTVSELIAAVRHAPSPQISEKVELLPLPEPYACLTKLQGGYETVFTAEQYRQGQRDAIAAFRRAAATVLAELIEAADATVERWHSRDWKQPHTAEFVARLSAAVGAAKAAPASASAGQAAPVLREVAQMLLDRYDQLRGERPYAAEFELLRDALAAQPAEVRAGQAGQVADAALERAAKIAENFGPSRPIATPRPSEIIKGRWEGEQAASSTIAALIRGCKYASTERAAAPADQPSAQKEGAA